MGKKSGGLISLLTGVALGAASVFFSRKENRDKTEKLARKTVKKVKVEAKKATTKAKIAVKKLKQKVERLQLHLNKKTKSLVSIPIF